MEHGVHGCKMIISRIDDQKNSKANKTYGSGNQLTHVAKALGSIEVV